MGFSKVRRLLKLAPMKYGQVAAVFKRLSGKCDRLKAGLYGDQLLARRDGRAAIRFDAHLQDLHAVFTRQDGGFVEVEERRGVRLQKSIVPHVSEQLPRREDAELPGRRRDSREPRFEIPKICFHDGPRFAGGSS